MIRILHQVSKHLILVWQWIVPGMISFNVHHLIDHTVGLILGSSAACEYHKSFFLF